MGKWEDYTPDTGVVEIYYATAVATSAVPPVSFEAGIAEFQRWLAAHDRKVRLGVLSEAITTGDWPEPYPRYSGGEVTLCVPDV